MSSEPLQGNAVIGQSGGPTAVINQSLVGVVEGLQAAPGFTGKILGSRHAVDGMMKGDFIDLTDWPADRLDRLAWTPSSGLGSSRHKPKAEDVALMTEQFKQHDIRYFFYIGGNDSSDTCRIVSETAAATGYDMHAFHVPKTVDNDLVLNDHTPGWGSAAKFVAQAFMGDDLDNQALPGVKINVVMGRHAGFLTAASVLGRRPGTNDGPHLVYVPEADFDAEQFCKDVQAKMNQIGRCVVAVSEGIHDKDGTPMAAKLAEMQGKAVEKDAHGNVQLSGSGALADFLAAAVKQHLGKGARVRADTFGYLQRSFVGCTSETDAGEARAAGAKAAELATSGIRHGSIAIQRKPGEGYAVEYNRIELTDVAAKTQHLPTEWIVTGNDISPMFIDYAAPIVGELPVIERIE
ncbi:MAG: diphosphate--fructose-6-phosphate 1-phosphotransferase [Planctomycetota bacterium]